MSLKTNLGGRVRFYLNRLHEKLWVKPLAVCLLSVLAAFLAGQADRTGLAGRLPDVSPDSLKALLSILSTSMLVMAVFAVGAMLAAYTSVSNTATPRSFPVVISDDVSQNALSTFIGAFIYSSIAQVALFNGYYGEAGRFVLFLLTVVVFALVVLSFVSWVDRIARLGRLGTTVDKIEAVAARALQHARRDPTQGAGRATGEAAGEEVYAETVGYVQRVEVASLQSLAKERQLRIRVAALPGTFAAPGKPLAYVQGEQGRQLGEEDLSGIDRAFVIGGDRTFDEDPRFGLVVLCEIASRALSPAVNDPGTAIDIIGTQVRLLKLWADTPVEDRSEPTFDRVTIREISLDDMLDDAFNAIARDGAGIIEVAIRLQKAFHSLASFGDDRLRELVIHHARYALHHAEATLKIPEDLERLHRVSSWLPPPAESDHKKSGVR